MACHTKSQKLKKNVGVQNVHSWEFWPSFFLSVRIMFKPLDTFYCLYSDFFFFFKTEFFFHRPESLAFRLNSAWYQHANTVPLPSCHAVREFTVSSYRCYPCSLSLVWEWGGDRRQGEHRRWQPHKTQSPFLTMGTFLNCREHGEEFKHFHLIIIISKNRHEKENPVFFFLFINWGT